MRVLKILVFERIYKFQKFAFFFVYSPEEDDKQLLANTASWVVNISTTEVLYKFKG